MTSTRITTVIVAISACFVLGCSKGDPFNRQEVSGTVTLKGQTVANGSIYFEPLENQGVATNCTIADGKFKLGKENGLAPGKYKWELVVLDRPAGGGEGGGMDTGKPSKNLVPAAENGKTFEVKAAGENVLTIAIP